MVKKGYVPYLETNIGYNYINFNTTNDTSSPDYISQINGSVFMNISELFCYDKNKLFKNIAINFKYNTSDLILSNYTFNYTFTLFGSFLFNVYTAFGGNLLNSKLNFINIQSIKDYPFNNIQINIFDLNCSLTNGLSLECFLKVNISNYANSFEIVSIDFGDGTSNLIQFNPYCKYFSL